MTRYDLLRQVNIQTMASCIILLGNQFPKEDDRDALVKHLTGKITEEELQRINDAVLERGGSPLIFIP